MKALFYATTAEKSGNMSGKKTHEGRLSSSYLRSVRALTAISSRGISSDTLRACSLRGVSTMTVLCQPRSTKHWSTTDCLQEWVECGPTLDALHTTTSGREIYADAHEKSKKAADCRCRKIGATFWDVGTAAVLLSTSRHQIQRCVHGSFGWSQSPT